MDIINRLIVVGSSNQEHLMVDVQPGDGLTISVISRMMLYASGARPTWSGELARVAQSAVRIRRAMEINAQDLVHFPALPREVTSPVARGPDLSIRERIVPPPRRSQAGVCITAM